MSIKLNEIFIKLICLNYVETYNTVNIALHFTLKSLQNNKLNVMYICKLKRIKKRAIT